MQCEFIAFTRALVISFMLGCFGGIEVCVQENEKHCMLMNMNMKSHFNKSSSSWVQGSSLGDTSDVDYDNYGGTYANQSPSLGMLSYGKLHTVHEEEEEEDEGGNNNHVYRRSTSHGGMMVCTTTNHISLNIVHKTCDNGDGGGEFMYKNGHGQGLHYEGELYHRKFSEKKNKKNKLKKTALSKDGSNSTNQLMRTNYVGVVKATFKSSTRTVASTLRRACQHLARVAHNTTPHVLHLLLPPTPHISLPSTPSTTTTTSSPSSSIINTIRATSQCPYPSITPNLSS